MVLKVDLDISVSLTLLTMCFLHSYVFISSKDLLNGNKFALSHAINSTAIIATMFAHDDQFQIVDCLKLNVI